MICLSLEELSEALSAINVDKLFVAGEIKDCLILVTGVGKIVKVPLSEFEIVNFTKPDFDKFSLIDYGQTIKFGDYEINSEFILEKYGFNPIELTYQKNNEKKEGDK